MSNDDQFHSALDYQFGSMNISQPSHNPNSLGIGPGVAVNPQSASARFERFFNTGPSMGDAYGAQSFQGGPSLLRGPSPSPYGNIGGAVPSNIGPGGVASAGPFYAGPSSAALNPPGTNAGLRARPPLASPGIEQPRSGVSHPWGPEPPPGIGALGLNATSPISPSVGLPPLNGYYTPQPFHGTPPAYPLHPPIASASDPNDDDDVIPTAIVVKNIPFSVKKEQLLQIIEDLAIPMPYAFNYHYDQGIFRGLAFANFRSPEEADAVVAALNGFDVAGRKLRVEYKKVLQAGEKERIEKEKAIKRMRSMVMEKERLKRESGYGSSSFGLGDMPPPPLPGQTSPLPPTASSLIGSSGPAGEQRDGHRSSTYFTDADYSSPPPLTADALESVPSSSGYEGRSASAAGSERSHTGGKPQQQPREELDLNDAQTLEIYSRVLLFKDDRMRDELAFSRNLSAIERRTVHLVAQKLNLYHYSLGDGDDRHVMVAKHEVNTNGAHHRPLRSQASTIGRSNREAFHSGGSSSMGGSGSNSRSGLRGKKSAPDMKRNRDSLISGSSGQGGTFNASAFNMANGTSSSGYSSNNGSSLGRKSNGNLRDGYSSSGIASLMSGGGPGQRRPHQGGGGVGGAAGLQSLFASQFDVPPVPSLGAAYLGAAPPLSTTLSTHSSGSDANFLSRSDSPLSAISAGGYSNQSHLQQQQSQQQGLPPPHHQQHFHTLSGATSTGALRQPRGPPTPGGQGGPSPGDMRNFGPRSRLSAQSFTTSSGTASSSPHGGGGGQSSTSLNTYGCDGPSNTMSTTTASQSGPTIGAAAGGQGLETGRTAGGEQQLPKLRSS